LTGALAGGGSDERDGMLLPASCWAMAATRSGLAWRGAGRSSGTATRLGWAGAASAADSNVGQQLAGVQEAVDHLARQVAEKEAQAKAGALDARRTGADVRIEPGELQGETIYDFSPEPRVLLDELLPLTVKTALFQCFLDATTSEHVARMVAMKSATDNADKMVKALTMKYNRARQSQITTELSEIMGGVEAMKG